MKTERYNVIVNGKLVEVVAGFSMDKNNYVEDVAFFVTEESEKILSPEEVDQAIDTAEANFFRAYPEVLR